MHCALCCWPGTFFCAAEAPCASLLQTRAETLLAVDDMIEAVVQVGPWLLCRAIEGAAVRSCRDC